MGQVYNEKIYKALSYYGKEHFTGIIDIKEK